MRLVGIGGLGIFGLFFIPAGCSDPIAVDPAEAYALEGISSHPVPGAILGEWAIQSGEISFTEDGACMRSQSAIRIAGSGASVKISMLKCRWTRRGQVITITWTHSGHTSEARIRGKILTLKLEPGVSCIDQACDATWTEKYRVAVGA